MGNGLKSMGDRFEIWRAGIPEVGASFPATILRERLINGVSTVFINRKTRRIANRSRMQRPGLFDELSRIIPTKIRNGEIEREREIGQAGMDNRGIESRSPRSRCLLGTVTLHCHGDRG